MCAGSVKGEDILTLLAFLNPAALTELHARLRDTGRGKHIHPFSYYHHALLATAPGVRDDLSLIRTRLGLPDTPFNVLKLGAQWRISFLLYEPFHLPFPALLAAESCHLARGTVRRTDYADRSNPPILHRKELLLPPDHPLVPEAANLTQRLERLGALCRASTIGTRSGWLRRMAELGLDESGLPLT